MSSPPSCEQLRFDLVVVGGGLAGLCAALAAARHGARVALVQERPVLGGTSSSEIRVVPYGCSHNSAWANETGLMHDLVLEDRAGNHEHFFDHGMMNSHYDLTLREAARRERNLTLFLNTSVRRVDAAPADPAHPAGARRIDAVHASQLGSEREFTFSAPQFLDATGDGTVGFLAGAEYRYGREARAEFGENLAPLVADDTTMGSTITMRARDLGRPAPFTPPSWVEPYTRAEDFKHDRQIYHLGKPVFGGYWWLEVCNPYHQIKDNAAIRDELHRHVLGVWNYIKNHHPERAKWSNYALEWIGQIPGKRESRRLVGDVTLTEHDCHEDRQWPDGIAYAGWWIDLHMKGGILNKTDPAERENLDAHYRHWIRVSPFSIPLRCFYSRNVANLWFAGRLISATHVALGPVRVQLSLAAAGQAVGTAAAWALRRGLAPRAFADPAGPHIAPLRQQLLKDDLRLLGLRNGDPADLALRATATATSAAPLDFGEPEPAGPWHALTQAWAQVAPLSAARLDRASFFLRHDGSAPTTVRFEVQELARIWDRQDGRVVARGELLLPPGARGWHEVALDAVVARGRPHRFILHPAPGVHWATTAAYPTGTVPHYLHVCPGGVEPKNAHLPSLQEPECVIPPYRHWRQWLRMRSLALRIAPTPRPYEPAMAVNGWAWPEALPNLWISDPGEPLPQALELRWPAPVACDTVLVSFDTSLHYSLNDRLPFSRTATVVRHWRVLAEAEAGGWRAVFEETDNYQRRRTARFPRLSTRALRLECLATHGDRSARIYEVRVYSTSGDERTPPGG